MAPSYDSDPGLSPFGNIDSLQSFYLDTLPGAQELAGWMEGKVQWLASKAVRSTFKFFGVRGPRSATDLDAASSDEARIPGHIIVQTRGGSTAGDIGYYWVDYTVVLLDPQVRVGGFGLEKAATDPSALALSSGFVVGDTSSVALSGNQIAFARTGFFTIVIQYTGTDPLPDHDGHTITDAYGTDAKSSRLVPAYDVSDGTFDSAMAFGDQALNTASSTVSQEIIFLQVEIGDVLTIDNVTSGTTTRAKILVIEGGLTMMPRA
jgi:hypothetical protein